MNKQRDYFQINLVTRDDINVSYFSRDNNGAVETGVRVEHKLSGAVGRCSTGTLGDNESNAIRLMYSHHKFRTWLDARMGEIRGEKILSNSDLMSDENVTSKNYFRITE